MVYRNRDMKHRRGAGRGDEDFDQMCGRRRRMRHGRGEGRGHGHRGGRRRPLNHGDLRLLILELVSDEARHGYDLIREIETRTGGAYVPSPGVIYPALEALLDLGWVEAEMDGQRRTFRLTQEGRKEREASAEVIEGIEARLADLQESERPEDPQDVRGAMHRLRHTVRDTVRAGSNDEDTRKAISDILADAQERIAALKGE